MAGYLLLENGSRIILESGTGDLLLETLPVSTVFGSAALTANGSDLTGTGYHTIANARWIILARIYLDSGIQNYSDLDVQHPSWFYVGRVLQWGTIDRSIPSPSGLPQYSQATISLADTDRFLRDTFCQQTPRRRVVQLKLVQEGTSESAVQPFYTGEILMAAFPAGQCKLILQDHMFAWLDDPIPEIGTVNNFPTLDPAVGSFFFPIITGDVLSNEAPAQGAITFPHIGYDGASVDIYAVACHPVFVVQKVFRKLPGDDLYLLLAEGVDYRITEGSQTINGVDYTLTFCQLFGQQPDGTDIRGDVQGIDFRGGWNGYGPVGYDPIENPTGTPGALRNPIDFFINMTFVVLANAGTSVSFNAGQIMALRSKFDALGYKCDGAITQSMTCREFLGQFLACFNMDMFVDINGLITLGFTDESDPGRPVFTEDFLMSNNSYTESLANPTANQTQYLYNYNFATNTWYSQPFHDNTANQSVLGVPELDQLQMYYCRDDATALDVVQRRMIYEDLGSYRQTFDLPLPEVSANLELARLVGITHREGLAAGGYTNMEAKTLDISINLDTLTATITTILRVPATINVIVIGAANLIGSGSLSATAGGAVLNEWPDTQSGELALEIIS